ncbi:hypothetical protein Acr_08g0011380 [Actinidia rufa]|uniref:DUF4283 domain-containing protein n=1 Tax=Actinidia rufa TaxID=165716 RepID=A0A7J0F233_9ERIC|nr:hypothetical protein Acr_08g0011380 [Actinidia rufa]
MFKNRATVDIKFENVVSEDLNKSPTQGSEGVPSEKTRDAHCESSDVREDRAMGKSTQEVKKKTYVSLFVENRLPSNGSKLEVYNQEEGPIKLGEEDIQGSNFPWERYLIGSMEDQSKVLENGLYIIYGSPLLLKPMPKYFNFGKEAISSFPIWVQLRNIPLLMWKSMVFGKIYSKLGRPIHVDKLTAQRERVTYARCLVEVDMAKDLVHSVMLQSPDREDYEQVIYYENFPRLCPHCRVVGQTKESCKVKNPIIAATATPTETNKGKGKESDITEVEGQITASRIGDSKRLQQEWIIKQTMSPKSKNGNVEVGNGSEAATLLDSIPEVPKTIEGIPHPPDLVQVGRGNIYPAIQPNSKWRAKKQASTDTQSPEWGLNMPLKQNGVLKYLRKNRVTIMGLMETKLTKHSLEGIARRRPLWDSLRRLSSLHQNPWILLGDFYNVLNNDERANGPPVSIPELRSKALKLAEAEMSFCSQLAKAKFLKNSDKGTNFFHNLIKNRRVKSNIPSIILEDGSRSTSNKQVSDAFVQYYIGLLGSKAECTRLNRDIVHKRKSLDPN